MEAPENLSNCLNRLSEFTLEELLQAENYLLTLRRFKQDYEKTTEHIREYLEDAAKLLGFEIGNDGINEQILSEIAWRYNRDIKRLMISSTLQTGLDAFKQGGYLAFWIRKLKPVVVPQDDEKWIRINEILAFSVGIAMIKSEHPGNIVGWGRGKDEKTENARSFIKNLVYHLRFGPASPAMITQTYYSIWTVVRDH